MKARRSRRRLSVDRYRGFVVVYIDFSCPYSYAMSERLRSAEDQLDWRLVEHAPEAGVPMGGDADPHEIEEVRQAAPEVELKLPGGLPNSGLASRVFAGLPPGQRIDFMHRVFRALWVEGWDISSSEVIEELAEGQVKPEATHWQAEWEALGIGVPALLREDGARCLGIVAVDELRAFLEGEGQSVEGVY